VDDLGNGDPIAALRGALEGSYQGFSFRLKGEPHVMPNESVRVQVALDYFSDSATSPREMPGSIHQSRNRESC
jgi:hypothetical protein